MELRTMYLEYNLQFFAKDGPGGEKTEQPTSKKLDDARKKGQVAKSQELVSAVLLMGLFIGLKFLIAFLGSGFQTTFETTYNKIWEIGQTSAGSSGLDDFIEQLFSNTLLESVVIMAPFLLIAFAVSVVMNMVQFRFKVSGETIKPKFSKMNPLNGFKRFFSKDSLLELAKSLMKLGLIAIVIWNDIENLVATALSLYEYELFTALYIIGDYVINIAIKIAAFYLIIGFADLIYQKWKFKSDMKMTKQEVKDEFKNTEGNPEIKGRIRSKMREASQRRMMQDVPKADVIITNPTHLAVALQYEENSGKAPVVLAKGEDYLAQKIKEVGRENHVEIVENKPLARMIYYNVEIGQEIPPELYQAVAEVLAFVYNLKNR